MWQKQPAASPAGAGTVGMAAQELGAGISSICNHLTSKLLLLTNSLVALNANKSVAVLGPSADVAVLKGIRPHCADEWSTIKFHRCSQALIHH
mmetsp:Transcript_16979/g.33177  ORF Transcript_16979/g.33177 Transcript_16979/m.33177 type:complete len:93 (-) Transcript_16979:279-557(-)